MKNPFAFIRRLYRRFRQPKFMLRNDLIIREAFVCGGKTYYQFDDVYNQPYQRALIALDYYEELRMRVTFDYLKLHVTAVKELINGGKSKKQIDVVELAKLNSQLEERLSWIVTPDLLYKFASVIFFDKTESPTTYDFKYAQRKIEHWKKSKPVNDFFLQMPIVKLVPFLKDCEVNFQAYSEVVTKLEKHHLANTLSHISEITRKKESVADSISREEIRLK